MPCHRIENIYGGFICISYCTPDTLIWSGWYITPYLGRSVDVLYETLDRGRIQQIYDSEAILCNSRTVSVENNC